MRTRKLAHSTLSADVDMNLFPTFQSAIQSLRADLLDAGAKQLPTTLRLYPLNEQADPDGLETFYTPFEQVNSEARIVLIGITPGYSQLVNGLSAAKLALSRGQDLNQALARAKQQGAFQDARNGRPERMRPNISRMLDDWGIQRYLGLEHASEIWSTAWHLVHTTSVLPHAVFKNRENYEGKNPHILDSEPLKKQVLEYLVPQLKEVPDALYLPLGVVPSEVMEWLAESRAIDRRQVVTGLCHPSSRCTTMIDWLLGLRAGPAPRGTPVQRYRLGREAFAKRFA